MMARGSIATPSSTEYDAQGHIISKTNPLGQISTYQYDTVGNLILSNEAGSSSKATSYDSLGRPLTLKKQIERAIPKQAIPDMTPREGLSLKQIPKETRPSRPIIFLGSASPRNFLKSKPRWDPLQSDHSIRL